MWGRRPVVAGISNSGINLTTRARPGRPGPALPRPPAPSCVPPLPRYHGRSSCSPSPTAESSPLLFLACITRRLRWQSLPSAHFDLLSTHLVYLKYSVRHSLRSSTHRLLRANSFLNQRTVLSPSANGPVLPKNHARNLREPTVDKFKKKNLQNSTLGHTL